MDWVSENTNIMIAILCALSALLWRAGWVQRKIGMNSYLGSSDILADYQFKRSPTPVAVKTKKTGKRYLVIGGHGFVGEQDQLANVLRLVGSHIVEALLERGETDIVVLDIMSSPIWDNCPAVKVIMGDIRSAEDVNTACRGVDTVFHTAAVINFYSRLSHDFKPSFDVNCTGTKNVVEACKSNGVRQLIYTSSYSVVLNTRLTAIQNGDESMPYASAPYLNHYVSTKIEGEKIVLEANGHNDLRTGSIRPTGGIFGPRDNLITRMWKENEGGQILFIGIPHKKQDWIYVENVVHSHLCMEEQFDISAQASGQAFFVSNNEPLSCIDMYTRFAKVFNTRISELPISLLYCLASIAWLSRGALKGKFFFLTPATLKVPRTEMYFNCSKAEREIGYKPIVTFDEGLIKTVQYCRLFSANKKSSGS